MTRIDTASASPTARDEHLVRVPLEHLHNHPMNPNKMSELALTKLTNNVMKTGHYPPLIRAPSPAVAGRVPTARRATPQGGA